MESIRGHLGIHAQSLVLRDERNKILASNIANAATPNFKARDIDFASELAKVSGQGPLGTTHAEHIGTQGVGQSGQLGYRTPVNASMDGNTVELAVEQMEFSENTLRYSTSLQLLNRKIGGLMSAIKGE